MRRGLRRAHKWIGVLACLFTLIVSVTAIALNHRDLWVRGVQADADFNALKAQAQALDPFNAQHALASDAHHLYESWDGGQSWQELKLYIPAEDVNNIVFSPQEPDLLWVSLRDVGLFSSDDGGYVWEELSDLPFDPVAGESIQKLSVGQDNALFVQTIVGQYLYRESQWSTIQQAQAGGLSLQEWVWRLHTGRFGSWGILLYDAVALSLIFLTLTGLVLSVRPRRKTRKRQGLQTEAPREQSLQR